jgi:enamine deaminase RidA (YjgF/YER057c/UK114 family)
MAKDPDGITGVAADPYERLRSCGITLPKPLAPIANYLRAVSEGELLYVSGQGPRDAQGRLCTGKVGSTIGEVN